MNEYNFGNLYNTYKSLNEYSDDDPDPQKFIDYINGKWLVPIGTKKKDLEIYKIWKEEDKNGIVDMAVKCKLYNISKSRVTFMRVMRTMAESLGYEIETGNKYVNEKTYL